MAEEIDVENGRNSNFEGVVTLTLTFDPAVPHTVVHHSSTSTYIPNFIQFEETFCGRTDVQTYGRTGGRTFFPSILLGRLSEVDLKMTSLCDRFSVSLGVGESLSKKVKSPNINVMQHLYNNTKITVRSAWWHHCRNGLVKSHFTKHLIVKTVRWGSTRSEVNVTKTHRLRRKITPDVSQPL